MQIEIDVPRPFITLALAGAIGWGMYVTFGGGGVQASVAEGGQPPAVTAAAGKSQSDYAAAVAETAGNSMGAPKAGTARLPTEAELQVERGRAEQAMLRKKTDILRGQLRVLDAERAALEGEATPGMDLKFQNASRILQGLLQDQQRADDFLLTALGQIWEAQRHAIALGADTPVGAKRVLLAWPVSPTLGISATFHDPAYQDRFGFAHDAVDIPVLQGTEVRSAADGSVEEVADHGLGFNFVTIKHADGTVTLYGHLTEFSVQRGQTVRAGDVLGLSGGRPGTPGAGLSTGPHLHFGVFRGGTAVNPLENLPSLSSFVGMNGTATSSSSSARKTTVKKDGQVPVLKLTSPPAI